jgi:hypothetical protein
MPVARLEMRTKCIACSTAADPLRLDENFRDAQRPEEPLPRHQRSKASSSARSVEQTGQDAESSNAFLSFHGWFRHVLRSRKHLPIPTPSRVPQLADTLARLRCGATWT